MSAFENISSNKCEMCGKKAKVAMNDKDMVLHYCCENHALQLWDKLGKP